MKLTLKWIQKNETKICVEHAHLREDEFSIEVYDEVEMYFRYLENLLYTAAASEIEQLRSIRQ